MPPFRMPTPTVHPNPTFGLPPSPYHSGPAPPPRSLLNPNRKPAIPIPPSTLPTASVWDGAAQSHPLAPLQWELLKAAKAAKAAQEQQAASGGAEVQHLSKKYTLAQHQQKWGLKVPVPNPQTGAPNTDPETEEQLTVWAINILKQLQGMPKWRPAASKELTIGIARCRDCVDFCTVTPPPVRYQIDLLASLSYTTYNTALPVCKTTEHCNKLSSLKL